MKNSIVFTFLTAVACFITTSCSNQAANVVPQSSVVISGEVENPQPGIILLEEFAAQSNSFEVYDTIPLNTDNTFSREVFLNSPGFFRLNFFNKQFVSVILDEDDIHVKADGSTQRGISEINGSTDVDKLRNFATVINEYKQMELSVNEEYVKAISGGDRARAAELTEEYMDLQVEKTEVFKSEIEKMGICLATVQALSLINRESEFEFVDRIVGQLAEKYPDVVLVTNLVNEMDRLRAVAVGQMAPEIALPTPDGDIFKLSSLRGNYVLVDFWAEWCKPCRMENPNVVRAYNRFKDQGFEVLGVSLDRTKDKWLKGIAEDGLEWTHVSDLKYFNSEAAIDYSISAIPFSVLVDPEGKIVAKNLRGQALHKKLEEIYGTAEGTTSD